MGWWVVESFNGVTNYYLDQNTEIFGPITVVAEWQRIQNNDVIVTFNSNGAYVDALPMNLTVPAGSTLESLPSPPQWNGYAFVGWNRRINGTGAEVNTGIPINESMTVYAQWRRVESFNRIVSFNSTGGSFVEPKIVEENTAAGFLPVPVRRGYTFNGWYGSWDSVNASAVGTQWSSTTWVYDNETLFADWVPRNYNVIFDLNGGSGTLPLPQSGLFDENVDLPGGGGLIAPLLLTDYVFDGWSTSISSGTIFRDGLHSIEELLFGSDANNTTIRLFARWRYEDPDTTTISFNSLGGTFVETRIVNKGTTISAPPNPQRPGYRFDGWYSQDGSFNGNWGTNWTFPRIANESATLYAQWEPNTYIFNFNMNGSSSSPPTGISGSYTGNVILPDGTGITPPAGRVFEGWSTQPSGGTIFRDGSNPVEVLLAGRNIDNPFNPFTLYAQWAEFGVEMVNVTFRSENANIITVPVVKGQSIPAESRIIPIRTGYEFSHWNTQGTTTEWIMTNSVNADMILIAVWSTRTYTVRYNANNPSSPGTAESTQTFGGNFTIPALNNTIFGSSPFTAPSGLEFKFWTTEPGNINSTRYYPGQIVRNIPGWDAEPVSPALIPVVNLYAYWDLPPDPGPGTFYNIRFNDGAVFISSISVKENEIIDPDDIPRLTRRGFDLVGWYIYGGSTPWIENANVTANVSLNTNWVEREYNVTYLAPDAVLSSIPGQQEDVKFNNTLTIGTAPIRAGYSFQNWNTASDGTGSAFFPGQSLSSLPGWGDEDDDHTFTLYAVWEAVTYRVSFNSNGGTFVGDLTDITHGATFGSLFTPGSLPVPTLTGYYFEGWWTINGGSSTNNADWGTRWIETTEVTGSRTLFAKWSPVSYIVAYHYTGGGLPPGVTEAPRSTHTYDKPENLTANIFIRSGHTFIGWNTVPAPNSTNPGVFFHDEQNVLNLRADNQVFDLYAQWAAIPITYYTVTFNTLSTIVVPSQTVADGDLADDPNPDSFTRPGYEFMGWYDANGTGGTWGDPWDFEDDEVTSNITLYARWEPVTYTIIYHANGGIGASDAAIIEVSYNVIYNQSHTIPNIGTLFSRAGSIFRGWNTEQNPTSYNPGRSFADGQTILNLYDRPEAIYLYAQWEVNIHMVTFNLSYDNQFLAPQFVQHGSFAFRPANPANRDHPGVGFTSYTFEGWTLDESLPENAIEYEFGTDDSYRITEPITLYAMWAEDEELLTITFNWNYSDPTPPAPPTPQQVFLNGIVDPPPDTVPERTDYLFSGWSDIQTGGELWNFIYPVESSMTLYAQWTYIDPGIPIPPQWTNTIIAGANAHFNAVEVGPDGSVYAVGYITGSSSYNFGNNVTISGSNSGTNSVIVKYAPDSDGVWGAVWARSVSGGGASMFNDIAVIDNNIYVAGVQTGRNEFTYAGSATTAAGPSTAHNPVIVKFVDNNDPDLVQASWARTVSSTATNISTPTRFHGIAAQRVNGEISIYVVGSQRPNAAINFGSGVTIQTSWTSYDSPIIVKYDDSGNAVWGRSVLQSSNNISQYDAYFYAVAVDGAGGVYAAGRQDGYDAAANNGYVIGTTYDYGNGNTIQGRNSNFNAQVVKYQDNGTTVTNVWSSLYSTTSTAHTAFYSIAVHGDHVFAGGSIDGGSANQDNESNGQRPLIARFNASDGTRTGSIAPTASTNTSNVAHNIRGLAISGDTLYAAGALYRNYYYTFSYSGGTRAISGPSSGNPNTVLLEFNTTTLNLVNETIMRSPGGGNARLLGIAIDRRDSDNVIVYAVGYQNGNSTYNHGNGDLTNPLVNKAGTSGDNPIIVRY